MLETHRKNAQNVGVLWNMIKMIYTRRESLQRQVHLVSESIGISNILYVLGAIKKLKSMHIVQVIGNSRKR